MDDTLSILNRFIHCINTQDLDGLTDLMSSDHMLIDAEGQTIRGKDNCSLSWRTFFVQYPDYKNHFENIISRGNTISLDGYSTCSEKSMQGHALWSAKVNGEFVAEWRIHFDTASNRETLGLTV